MDIDEELFCFFLVAIPTLIIFTAIMDGRI